MVIMIVAAATFIELLCIHRPRGPGLAFCLHVLTQSSQQPHNVSPMWPPVYRGGSCKEVTTGLAVELTWLDRGSAGFELGTV